MNSRSINHQTALWIKRYIHPIKRCVPQIALWSVQSAKSYMRKRFRHTISTPNGIRHILQGFCQFVVDGPTTDNQMTNLPKTLRSLLEQIPYLQRHHRSKVYRPLPFRTALRFDGNQSKTTGQGSYHHHHTSNIVERHAEQCRIALLQSKKTAGDASRSLHAPFLYKQWLRLSRRPTGMHQHRL